jgi:hypothetical protein
MRLDAGVFDEGRAQSAAWRQAYLTVLRSTFTERLGGFAAARVGYELWRELDPPQLAHRVTTEMLGKATGPRTYEASESATALVVGFATWRDMFKATYRGRWWMRWRRWKINYIERTETKQATVRVQAELAVLFPHAQDLPEWLGGGYPVILQADRLAVPEIDKQGS